MQNGNLQKMEKIYQRMGEDYEHQDRYVVRDGYLIFDRTFMFWEKKFKIEKLTKKELILSYFDDSDSPSYIENTIKVHAEFKRI